MREPAQSLENWVKKIPASRMVYPDQLLDRTKYMFWHFFTPFHPAVRSAAESMGIRRQHFEDPEYRGRQHYLLGTIAPGLSTQEFILHCIERGYGNHFVAWHDEGQLMSLRYVENFTHQYHLRVFEDGEVRGHYEYTPESYPIRHIRAMGLQDRRRVFYEHLGDRIVRAE